MAFFDRTMAKSYKRSNTPPFIHCVQVSSNVSSSSCLAPMLVVRTSLHHKRPHVPCWSPFIVSSQLDSWHGMVASLSDGYVDD
ncbi:hypothetical protein LY76DRAFT_589968 [Colletotrichum caudatum]|nr:hypothetical protein LY76DRAFT_589968 [Colletotrichum caudatum]